LAAIPLMMFSQTSLPVIQLAQMVGPDGWNFLHPA
jgi:hypothetical protein